MKKNSQTMIIAIIAVLLIVLFFNKGILFQGSLLPGETLTFTENVTGINKTIRVTSENCNVAMLTFVSTSDTVNGQIISGEQVLWDGQNPGSLTTIDLCPLFESLNTVEGSVILTLSADTGNIVISSLNIEFGPTNAYISACENTGGTIINDTCLCPEGKTFIKDEGCKEPITREEEPQTTSSGTSTSQTSTEPEIITTPMIQKSKKKIPVAVWGIIILVILYAYFTFIERGKGGLFKKI